LAEDLSAPLGKKKSRNFPPQLKLNMRELPLGRILAAVLAVILAIVVLRIMLVEDPDGGRPDAEVLISSTRNTNSLAQELGTPPDAGPVIVTQSPVRDSPGITPPDDSPEPVATPPAQDNVLTDFGIYPDLGEETKYGIIPRISSAGRTPFEAYARPSARRQAAGGKAMIAIVVTGMGLNEAATLNAIVDLPDNITLAFAPYSRALERTVAAARAGGHELMLEAPMEPFDYPNSDPGPQTLLTGQPARANLDRLFWLMSRTGGYIGLINNLGARFTSSASDLSPIMEELGLRGLAYLDDGSSNRSLTRQLATANRVPFARASALLDANPSRAAILAELEKLEAAAREQGQAIGIISALPVSIATIVNWARGLQERQMELVPVSALMKPVT